MKKATLIMVMFLAACTKIAPAPQSATIDLGVQSQSTSIKSVVQINNTITAVFETTPGSKYSVQVVPFGSEKPSFKEGFTASDATTQKIYNLSTLTKRDYDLIFIDISGNEVKYPIIIK
jgi:cellulose biosynthesis protein BcsQ